MIHISTNKLIQLLVVTGCVFWGCSNFEPPLPDDADVLDGPVEGLTTSQNAQFLAGDVAFNDVLFNSSNGLGPLFVATSCGSCHAGDGKGTPFTTLTRFGQTDSSGNQYLLSGGPQLQNRALPGYTPETIPPGATSSKFTPPANTGLGFIELVSDADILAMSDPNDINGDGISGIPNWNHVPAFVNIPPGAVSQNGKHICRFGKKAATFNLMQQTIGAYNQDMGIVSSYMPTDTWSGLEGNHEVDDNSVTNVVAYLQTLKAPVQRSQNDATVIAGKLVFKQIGCEKCHKETLKTGFSPVTALSNKFFHPYTDLLLHDMGSGLDDGYTEGSATTAEWRTPPLWGLGLSPNSQGGNYFLMHDGRALSIQDAILMHGGEGMGSRNNFIQLSQHNKEALIRFLESL